jgi:hypothetical protein
MSKKKNKKKNEIVVEAQETSETVTFIKPNKIVPFVQHKFDCKLTHNIPDPEILISIAAYNDLLSILRYCKKDEIGFLGTVQPLESNRFLIDEILDIPKQEDNTSTCELTEDGLGDLMTKLLTDGRDDACEKMHFWGHVHPSNSTAASPQDDKQMEMFEHNDFFIRGIFGRGGKAQFTIYDHIEGLLWDDVPWSIHYPDSEESDSKWEAQIRENVSKKVYTANKNRGNIYNNKNYEKGNIYNGYNKKKSKVEEPLFQPDAEIGAMEECSTCEISQCKDCELDFNSFFKDVAPEVYDDEEPNFYLITEEEE